MKKVIVCMASVAMLGMGMTSCQKEKDANLSKVTFTATTEADNGKTTLNGQTLTWEQEGESIMVSDVSDKAATYTANSVNTDGTTATFACAEGEDITSAPFYATYPAGIYSDHNHVTLPATQQYVANSVQGFPMYAVSEDHTLQFKNLCGVMTLQLKGTEKVRSISITTNKKVNGTFEVASVTGGYQVAATTTTTASEMTVTLDCGNDGVQLNMDSYTEFNLYLPVGEYGTFTITITNIQGAPTVKKLQGANVMTVDRNTRYTLARTVEFPLPGGFTINDAGDQVHFSKGNLYYDGTAFHFEANQYDYHTYNAANDTWGLFGWSTDAANFNYGMSTSTVSSAYRGDFVDWGTAIGDGHTWRTLTMDEWVYILQTKYYAGKMGASSICGVTGLVLLPDNWTGSSAISASYNAIQWADMEAAGAVFLPCLAMYRSGGKVVSYSYSFYWSSTSDSDAMYAMGVGISDAIGSATLSRAIGCNVRLVQD